jgi:hypothetical protein
MLDDIDDGGRVVEPQTYFWLGGKLCTNDLLPITTVWYRRYTMERWEHAWIYVCGVESLME